MSDPSVDRLHELLVARFASEAEGVCALQGRLDRFIGGDRSTETRAMLEAHVARCQPCHEVLAAFEAATAAGLDLSTPPWDAPSVMPLRAHGDTPSVVTAAPRSKSWAWGLAASALIAGGIAALAIGAEDDSLVPKGGSDQRAPAPSDALHVALRRDGMDVVAADGDRLLAGDRLDFFYSSSSPGFLMIFDLEPGAAPTRLYPLRDDLGAITPGERQPLPVGASVGPGSGCEWLVAVFFAHAVPDEDAVVRALQRPRVLDVERCSLEVALEGARAIDVHAFRR